MKINFSQVIPTYLLVVCAWKKWLILFWITCFLLKFQILKSPLMLASYMHAYRQSPAEQMPFEDGAADLVTAMTAAHWFDRPRFLLEADRLLRPGGCLALLSYTMDFELEYGDHSGRLNAICQEVRSRLITWSQLSTHTHRLLFSLEM